jgi:type III restriction enzyme
MSGILNLGQNQYNRQLSLFAPCMSITSLIINSPYERPSRWWDNVDGQLRITDGRRAAGYEIFDPRSNTKRVEPLDVVNSIRERVDEWRAAGYPGVTNITRELLEHWHDRSARLYPFFFCQLEAIETLIWWVEAPANAKQGIYLEGDGGPFERLCNKMATGSGKTAVMAMIITWQVLNATMFPKETKRFSKAILVIAPGITVKERLHVLYPGLPDNVYDAFCLCPTTTLRQRLNQAVLLVDNWHTLMPLKEASRSVVKKGKESDKAYVRRVLGPLALHKDLVVINDEAHHAYRVPVDVKFSKAEIEEEGIDPEEATRWIEGLDRIHGQQRITRCFDVSATPFVPTGKKSTDQGLFQWIVSDFGLNDAIEAGLVKTPRVVVRDGLLPDTSDLRPKLYHIYRADGVADDLNQKKASPQTPLPQLVQQAYMLLAADWKLVCDDWRAAGHATPPVMLTVCNRTETAARIEFFLNSENPFVPSLQAPDRTLRVDSTVLRKAEQGESGAADKDYEERLRFIVEAAGLSREEVERLRGLKKEELLREMVDSVGKNGKPGQSLQNVISVAMLSEGWDAKNVTHIMGLRAFSSQLLCEQVIGRGLRRVNYDIDEETGLFEPEYVNVFGVPLSIFIDDDSSASPPRTREVHEVKVDPNKSEYEITWPNILRVEYTVRPMLTMDWTAVEKYIIDPKDVPVRAEMAPALGGAEDFSQVKDISFEYAPDEFRLQRLIFLAAKKGTSLLEHGYGGRRDFLTLQLVHIVERFVSGSFVVIKGHSGDNDMWRRVLIGQCLDPIVQHVVRYVTVQNRESLEPVFDDRPVGRTGDMSTWYTSKQTRPALRSHINCVVTDSTWESFVASELDRFDEYGVQAWAKNDHLGFFISYLWKGSRRKYIPDFLIRLRSGETLVLEVKGQVNEESTVKRASLTTWIEAVNAHGGFGRWRAAEITEPSELHSVLNANQA